MKSIISLLMTLGATLALSGCYYDDGYYRDDYSARHGYGYGYSYGYYGIPYYGYGYRNSHYHKRHPSGPRHYGSNRDGNRGYRPGYGIRDGSRSDRPTRGTRDGYRSTRPVRSETGFGRSSGSSYSRSSSTHTPNTSGHGSRGSFGGRSGSGFRQR